MILPSSCEPNPCNPTSRRSRRDARPPSSSARDGEDSGRTAIANTAQLAGQRKDQLRNPFLSWATVVVTGQPNGIAASSEPTKLAPAPPYEPQAPAFWPHIAAVWASRMKVVRKFSGPAPCTDCSHFAPTTASVAGGGGLLD